MQEEEDTTTSNEGISGKEWLGITRDVVNVGSTGAGVGFNIARKSTGMGFGIATGVLDGLSWMGNSAIGPNPVSWILSGVSGIVGASAKVTDMSIQASQAITDTSLSVTSDVLRHSGAKDGQLLKAMGVDSETVDALVVVAKLISSFGEGLEFNYSIVNDLYLLSTLQQRRGMNNAPTGKLVDDKEIKAVQKYLPNALSAYGKLFCNIVGINSSNEEQNVKDDFLNVAKEITEDIVFISEMCKIKTVDVIDHKTDTSPYDPSYFIAVDRRNNAVIVTFRGTLSLSDFLTDLICGHVPYEIFETKGFVHKGFIEAAKKLSPRLVPLIFKGILELDEEQPLSLIVNGHSLGAAMATVLSVHWLVSGTFTGVDLQCYAFASPCVFSYPLSTHVLLRHLVKSIVVKNDLVPRLCHGSAFDVRGRILKVQELRRNAPAEYDSLMQVINVENEISQGYADTLYRRLDPDVDPKLRLFPAGTIYYATPSDVTNNVQLWHLPHEFLADILLSGSMLTDHMPQSYAKLGA